MERGCYLEPIFETMKVVRTSLFQRGYLMHLKTGCGACELLCGIE
jgi:hypothetical protein